MIVGD